MELEHIEGALADIAEKEGVSVKEVKDLICSLPIDKVKKHEAIMLIKMTLREVEKMQREEKDKSRKGDKKSFFQSRVDIRAYHITQLLRKYAELRGKDPKVHSLKKYGIED
jgi:hypothetical protein